MMIVNVHEDEDSDVYVLDMKIGYDFLKYTHHMPGEGNWIDGVRIIHRITMLSFIL